MMMINLIALFLIPSEGVPGVFKILAHGICFQSGRVSLCAVSGSASHKRTFFSILKFPANKYIVQGGLGA